MYCVPTTDVQVAVYRAQTMYLYLFLLCKKKYECTYFPKNIEIDYSIVFPMKLVLKLKIELYNT